MRPLFLEQSVADSIALLRAMEPPEGYYLAFSGGKDSCAVLRLCEMADVNFTAYNNHTSADPPELFRFIKAHYPSVVINKPPETMWSLIPRKLMPPTRMVRYCCEVLKERGGEGRVVLTGVRRAESPRRKAWKMVNPCEKNGRVTIHPILTWTDDEVWRFLEYEGVPHCSLYDEGFTRLGCVGCPLSYPAQRRREFERWPKYKDAYLRAFGRMLEERKRRGKDTQWQTPEDVMAWWLMEDS